MSLYLPSGFRGLLLTPCERRFSNAVREQYRGQDVLYHGTRYSRQILSSGKLLHACVGTQGVSLTRSPEVAAFSALLPRDDTNSPPAVLVLDSHSIRARYKLEPHHDGWLGHNNQIRDEAEEIILGQDITDLAKHLVGIARGETLYPNKVCSMCLSNTIGAKRICEHLGEKVVITT